VLNKHIIMSIETSCDETSIAILRDGKELLANVVSSQIDKHKEYGGVMPELASRLHLENIMVCINEALEEAKITYKDITLIAYTKGPGLIGALHVGMQAAKALSIAYDIPLLGVDHMKGHIYASRYISEFKFPALILVVSGGHSELVLMKDEYDFVCLGETKDDAIGECYDKVSRVLGLGYPGGPIIDKLAKEGNNIYELPYPRVEGKYDFSFSGLKTAVLNLVNNKKQRGEEFKNEDIAASFQKKAVDILIDKILLALDEYDIKQVMLAGGVSANKELREEVVKRVSKKKKDIDIVLPPLWCCTDNGAMTAMAAYYSNEEESTLSDGVNPNLSLND
jgi:N6-L-threonylcarbamoyladenine synthase